ncbi:hypothetical protein [Tranquillimonas alkanivorans]|uniref:Uncharacterized protein n=1 Tax=Tranquillimonas alkanivorans TaxID=441119 RepID=A0A1I5WDY8_9RHOB|nr:hypothetical protein [Tranquillimonas alkanivorans]SFQ17861.1 hypothetical protein SAMN04488047_14416 [Tranquillimonas alkanivorans]
MSSSTCLVKGQIDCEEDGLYRVDVENSGPHPQPRMIANGVCDGLHPGSEFQVEARVYSGAHGCIFEPVRLVDE